MDTNVIVVDERIKELDLIVLLLVEDVHRLGEVPQLLVQLVMLLVQGGQGLVIGTQRGGRKRSVEGVRDGGDIGHRAHHHGRGGHGLEHDQNINCGCIVQYHVSRECLCCPVYHLSVESNQTGGYKPGIWLF